MHPYYWLHWAAVAWIVFYLYWLVSARKLKAVKRREPAAQRLIQIAFTGAAFVLVFDDRLGRGFWGTRFVPESTGIGVAGLALAVAGVALAIWARWHLGENWSGMVTLKEGHELIRTGPYRRIRHPIYTGMLLAFVGTVLAVGQYRGLIALAVATTSFYAKARKEESFLAQEFGEAFREHARRTGMFLPKWT